MVAACSDSVCTLYVDGEAQATQSAYSPLSPYLSAIGGSQNSFVGDVDEFRIYDRVLSAAEVKNLYQCNVTSCPPTVTAVATATGTGMVSVTATVSTTSLTLGSFTATAAATTTITAYASTAVTATRTATASSSATYTLVH